MKATVMIVLLVTLLMVNACKASSSSSSCTMVNGKWRCVNNNDPNGNMAAASSFSNGRRGDMAAGAGYPGRFGVFHGINEG